MSADSDYLIAAIFDRMLKQQRIRKFKWQTHLLMLKYRATFS